MCPVNVELAVFTFAWHSVQATGLEIVFRPRRCVSCAPTSASVATVAPPVSRPVAIYPGAAVFGSAVYAVVAVPLTPWHFTQLATVAAELVPHAGLAAPWQVVVLHVEGVNEFVTGKEAFPYVPPLIGDAMETVPFA